MKLTTGRMCNCLLFLMLFTLELLDLTHADEPRESIGDPSEALRTLSYSINLIENKLERHEMRERALGELLKRSLQTLQRGQRNIETPLKGLEQRLSEMELILKRLESKLDTPNYEYHTPQVSLNHQMTRTYQEMLPPVQQVPVKRGLEMKSEDNEPEIGDQLIQISTNVENLLETSSYIKQQASLRNTPSPTISNEFENKLLLKFDELAASLQELRVKDKVQNEYTLASADRELMYGLTNDTLSAIENVKDIVKINADKVYNEMATLIVQTEQTLRSEAGIILKSINREADLMGRLRKQMSADDEYLNKIMENFSKSKTEPQNSIEAVQFNELFDKQREEIVNKLEKLLKTLDDNFNHIQMEAMQNLNTTIKNESSYIWRQISITNGDIASSAELLRQMRTRSEVFVNSVLQSMVSIGNEIENLNGRVLDIHTNQDYLLDNLTLLSQKFDVIKEKLSNTPE